MLKLSAIELFTRLIPEVLILIFASYAFSKTKIDGKKYVISVIILGMCVFTIRMLPINYGVHTILNIIALTVIVSCINKIDIIAAIKSSLVTAVLLFVSEGINVVLLKLTIGTNKLNEIIENPITKTIYFLPSLFGLAIIVTIYYYYLKKREKLNYV